MQAIGAEKLNRFRFWSVLLALQILLLPASILVISTLLFWVTVPVTVVHFPLGLAAAIGISRLIVRKHKDFEPPEDVRERDFFRVTLVFILLILVGLFISMGIDDFAREGRDVFRFHQAGILAAAGEDTVGDTAGTGSAFVDFYPRAPWVTAASLYKLTRSIHSGKVFHFLYLVAVFLVTFDFLYHYRKVPSRLRRVIALLTACNPVAIYQLFSLSDGSQLASLIGVTVILSFHYTMFRARRTVVLLAITLLSLSNIKFPGLVYGLVIALLSWLSVLIIDRDRQKHFVLYVSAAFFVAVAVVGFHPYVTNLVNKGNPFYGVSGVEEPLAPQAFMGKDRVRQLVYSLFSKSDRRSERMPRLKIPFAIDGSEIDAFSRGDVIYGGFGPLFGSVLLLVIAAVVFLFKSKRLILLYTFIGAGIILVSALVTSGVWCARLAPQLWLLPITFIVSFFYIRKGNSMAYIRGFALSLLLLNSFLVLHTYIAYNI